MYKTRTLLVAAAVLVFKNYCGAEDGNDYLNGLWNQHIKYANSFDCGIPQPRVFRAEDVGSEELKAVFDSENVHVFPATTVLHRCDSSGCCKSPNQGCLASSVEEVTLVFRVFPKLKSNSFSRSKRRHFVQIPAANHTTCSCQTLNNNQPK